MISKASSNEPALRHDGYLKSRVCESKSLYVGLYIVRNEEKQNELCGIKNPPETTAVEEGVPWIDVVHDG